MKHSSASLILCLGTALALISCSKEIHPPPAGAAPQSSLEGIVVENGLLRFETIEGYRSWVDQPDEAKRSSFVAGVRSLNGFTSLQELNAASSAGADDRDLADLIDDPYFKEMLNEDLAVWIADWVFRIDPSDAKVYVISSDKLADHYSSLVAQDLTDREVSVYSAEDEVLDILLEGRGGSSRCTAPSANAHHTANWYLWDNSGRYGHSHYAKYGIYFTMFSRIDAIGSSSPVFQFDYNGSIWAGAPHIFYKVRCGATADYSTISTGTWTGGGFRYQSYQGSTALEKVYFYTKIRSNYSPYPIVSDQFGFRQNI